MYIHVYSGYFLPAIKSTYSDSKEIHRGSVRSLSQEHLQHLINFTVALQQSTAHL